MKHPINITVINNANGIPQSNDGIMGIFAKAVAVAGTFALDTPYLLTSLSDLTPLGIDAAYDASNSVAVPKSLSFACHFIFCICFVVGLPGFGNKRKFSGFTSLCAM